MTENTKLKLMEKRKNDAGDKIGDQDVNSIPERRIAYSSLQLRWHQEKRSRLRLRLLDVYYCRNNLKNNDVIEWPTKKTTAGNKARKLIADYGIK